MSSGSISKLRSSAPATAAWVELFSSNAHYAAIPQISNILLSPLSRNLNNSTNFIYIRNIFVSLLSGNLRFNKLLLNSKCFCFTLILQFKWFNRLHLNVKSNHHYRMSLTLLLQVGYIVANQAICLSGHQTINVLSKYLTVALVISKYNQLINLLCFQCVKLVWITYHVKQSALKQCNW